MEVDTTLILAIISLLFLLFLTLFAYLVYSGLFSDVDIKATKPPFDGLTIAYKYARGKYSNCGQLFTEVRSIVPKEKCIGIYYDDPERVDNLFLRYAVGVIVDDGSNKVEQSVQELLLSKEYSLATFPAVDHVVMTTFPYRGSVSVIIGISKVYPKLKKYMQEKKLCAHPIMEIYDGETITFVAPLAKQDEFCVPETQYVRYDEEEIGTDHSFADEEVPSSDLDVQRGSTCEGSNVSGVTDENLDDSEIGRLRKSQSVESNGDRESDKGSSSSFEELVYPSNDDSENSPSKNSQSIESNTENASS